MRSQVDAADFLLGNLLPVLDQGINQPVDTGINSIVPLDPPAGSQLPQRQQSSGLTLSQRFSSAPVSSQVSSSYGAYGGPCRPSGPEAKLLVLEGFECEPAVMCEENREPE